MSKLKLCKPSETLNKGSIVRLDSPLFIAVMECIKKCGANVSRASEVKKLTVRLTI